VEAMSYIEQLSCKRNKCAGEMMVPLKLIAKGGSVILVARCPKCHASYKRILTLSDKKGWLSMLSRPFFQCDVCGTPNEDNYVIADSWQYDRVKTVTVCKNCRKKRAKVASKILWTDIVKTVKGPSEPPAPEPSWTAGPKCSSCDAPIRSGAIFCSNCGSTVEEKKEAVPSAAPPKEHICPTCHEEYDEGSIFCSVCGQELVCDKCGAAIREGALFCTSCGDAVTKGELSE